ncbi:hypothetical protein KPC83_02070 [Collinsella sp. zg1085]|uniref:hypothetical protein n=1 Tax=Collinsella sp. zg1085 TaxID=2844380 RepID=UPI001C0CD1B9|nr:hypothetical protein [Collinsella sp. zg1085]QWT17953.1 hypothetical protein KPC83_02070 [Collinsella sp. zg1085]
MALQSRRHPAIAAGIATGIGLIVPAALYAATIPFDDLHQVVVTSAAPFAAGSLLGAGVCALSVHALLKSANEVPELTEFSESAKFAQNSKSQEVAHSAASSSQDFAQEVRGTRFARADEDKSAAERLGMTGVFSRRAAKDIPIITRAADALSEAEAWAEIDKLLDENSPISCDAERSKDIYQIAFEELAKGASAERQYEESEKTAALRSLAQQSSTAHAAAQPSTVASVRLPVAAAVQASTAASAQSSVTAVSQATSTEVSVAVADYSGRESLWASALEIMSEDTEGALSPQVAHHEAEQEDTRIEAVARAPRASLDVMPLTPERAEAMAEGERQTQMHGHINEILGEELSKVSSHSMRRTSKEFLRVIQGRTASMPKLDVAAREARAREA